MVVGFVDVEAFVMVLLGHPPRKEDIVGGPRNPLRGRGWRMPRTNCGLFWEAEEAEAVDGDRRSSWDQGLLFTSPICFTDTDTRSAPV